MVSSISSSSTDYSRISGLASGMDTEEMIKGLLASDKNKIYDLEGQKQTYLWQQEAYHEIIDKLNDFDSEFFDYLNPESNILSNNGSKTASLYSSNIDPDRYIDILVNSDAVNGQYTINSIEQLATVASTQSSSVCSGSINGTVDLTSIPLDFTGKTFSISLDGTLREITVDSVYADTTEMMNDLNSKLESEFGVGRVQASLSVTNTLELSASNSTIQVISGDTDFLADVGIENSSRNIINLDSSVENVFNETENLLFTINDVSFSFDKSTSIRDIMDEINSSDANVKMSYNSLTDKFTLESKETGASSKISITNTTGNLFGASSYINITDTSVQNGQDAIFYLNDDTKTNPIKRSSNVFTIDGVTFSLKEITSENIEYTVENNTDGLYEKITSFVDKFNELFDSIDDKITEKKYLDFEPLTDEQKEAMSDEEVEIWEEKAKSGLLRNDNILSSMLTNLRSAFWDDIEGVSTTFQEIGISISSDYTKFEIEIDETTLKEAISKDPTSVMELFNKEEDISYKATLSSTDRSQRYEEVGFAHRVHDIIMDNVRTARDLSNNKGTLLEKAGLDGDATQYKNIIYDKISDIEESISKAIDRMNDREDSYWRKFTAMETALQRMSAQSAWFTSQFGG